MQLRTFRPTFPPVRCPTIECMDKPEGACERVFLVEREDPFVVSCAACGGVTQLWTHDPVTLLPWKVVEHWLTVHWDRAGLDEQADGA